MYYHFHTPICAYIPFARATTEQRRHVVAIAYNDDFLGLLRRLLSSLQVIFLVVPPIIPLVTNASSSHDAWKILAGTYASPSRGHIKQLQHRLKQFTKTPNQSITEYMQNIKIVVDELAILGKNMDQEDVNDVILNGLDQVSYKPIIDAIHGRDNPISFNELHEKLINHELSLAQ
ncbi:hypothetical protein E3N88_11052 [Mikania micrantha]|uniref:Retrotransposon gag domain-containing protein n=1 Tax=Mikania micrantha TaxID=192012 RepID=A0A5N6PCA2_9ASTR|nr:hypothetical protein E3N88_11052 [Mikania micrantha]